MKTLAIGLALLITAAPVWAQVGDLYNADIIDKTSVSDPAKAMKAVEGQWLAFSIPAIEGTRSPCCWSGKWNVHGEMGCRLEKRQQSYGSRSDAPLANNLIVYSRMDAGEVTAMRLVGESCPVDGGGRTVTWLGSVDETDAIDWLEKLVLSGDDHAALHALAVHRSEAAGSSLFRLARGQDSDTASQALFWIGHSRGEQGYRMLVKLLDEFPNGDTRREINFALTQNSSPKAVETLHQISLTDPDPEQRGGAMFWLSQEFPHEARAWLVEILASETNTDVLEQAIFAISQLPDGDGDALLFDLARDESQNRDIRRQAIFWLTQSESDESIAKLADWLNH